LTTGFPHLCLALAAAQLLEHRCGELHCGAAGYKHLVLHQPTIEVLDHIRV
jgi:hypothetical protein